MFGRSATKPNPTESRASTLSAAGVIPLRAGPLGRRGERSRFLGGRFGQDFRRGQDLPRSQAVGFGEAFDGFEFQLGSSTTLNRLVKLESQSRQFGGLLLSEVGAEAEFTEVASKRGDGGHGSCYQFVCLIYHPTIIVS